MHGLRFVLVEARDRLMPEISESLAAFAGAELRRRGIEIRLGTTIERVSADSTELSTGEVVPTRTVAWTAGVRPHPIVAELGLPLDDGGRIKVDRYCQVEGFDDVWAIGDAAAVPTRRARPADAADVPARDPPGPHGRRERRGRARRRARRSRSPTRRSACSSTWAATRRSAETLGIRWRGFPAWFLARTYHLMMMPGDPAARPARGRLDRRPAVRARLVRARPARPPAAARRPTGLRRAERRRHGPDGGGAPGGRAGALSARRARARARLGGRARALERPARGRRRHPRDDGGDARRGRRAVRAGGRARPGTSTPRRSRTCSPRARSSSSTSGCSPPPTRAPTSRSSIPSPAAPRR